MSGTSPGSPSVPDTLVRDSSRIALGTGLSRLTGLVRVGVFAWALGQTDLADTYNLANVAPNLLYELVLGGVLSATLVPLFVEADQDSESSDNDTRSVLMSVGLTAVMALTLLGLVILAGVAALRGDSPGDDSVEAQATVVLLALVLPQVVFYGLSTLAGAALNARRVFGPPAFTPILNNVVTSIALVVVGIHLRDNTAVLGLSRRDTAAWWGLGLGTTAGVAAMALPLVVSMRRHLPPLQWQPRFRDPIVSRLLRLSGWTVGYVVANQIALVIVTLILNARDDGSLTAYQQAFIFFQLPHGLFAVSLMTTVLPDLSAAHLREDLDAFRSRFLEGLRLVLVVILPAAAGYVALSTPVVSVLLERGAFNAGDTDVTGRTLAAFAVGLPGFSVYLYALRAFYARSDTRRPFVLNVIENAINVVMALIIAAATGSGAAGIALAFSVAYTVSAVGAMWRLSRELGGFGPSARGAGIAVGRMAAAAIAMGALVAGVAHTVGESGAATRVGVGVLVGVATYAGLSLALHIDEISTLVRTLRRRVGRG